jgi:RHS repeat-associated protein
LEVEYNSVSNGLGATPRFDGKVAAVKWKVNDAFSSNTSSPVQQSYVFSYDAIGQLTGAHFAGLNTATNTWNVNSGAYDESNITYDQNGNILGLKRYSLNNGSTNRDLIDELSYSYSAGKGNQLSRVDDAVSGGPLGFKDLAGSAEEYTYDANGNLTADANKGISLEYNEINKTSKVKISSTQYVSYIYAASGERLAKQVYSQGVLVKTQYYLAGAVYESTTGPTANLAYFGMAEGRVRHVSGVFIREYFITDHQGNVRVSFEEGAQGQAVVKQENRYYAFGLVMQGAINRTALPGDANKQLYNGGSELQDDFGDIPGYYSTPYREYDPVLGRFYALDPLAGKYSSATPYNYCFNDPLNMSDPSGAEPGQDTEESYNFYNRYVTNHGSKKYQEMMHMAYMMESSMGEYTDDNFFGPGGGFESYLALGLERSYGIADRKSIDQLYEAIKEGNLSLGKDGSLYTRKTNFISIGNAASEGFFIVNKKVKIGVVKEEKPASKGAGNKKTGLKMHWITPEKGLEPAA